MTNAKQRFLLEYGFWLLTLPLAWGLVAWNKLQTWHRYGYTVDYPRFYTEEITSCLGALVMVWFVAWWLKRFPLNDPNRLVTVASQLLGSFLFSLGHYTIYILLRVATFSLMGEQYHWEAGALYNIYYEYQKDLGPYIGIVAVIHIYRVYMRPTLQTESPTVSEDRLIVQTGRGEAVLKFADIDYLQSARNYVTLYARDREYLVRETLSSLQERLTGHRFERCHRSYLANLDAVSEIRADDDGRQSIILHSGAEIPLSRSYRESFHSRLRTP